MPGKNLIIHIERPALMSLPCWISHALFGHDKQVWSYFPGYPHNKRRRIDGSARIGHDRRSVSQVCTLPTVPGLIHHAGHGPDAGRPGFQPVSSPPASGLGGSGGQMLLLPLVALPWRPGLMRLLHWRSGWYFAAQSLRASTRIWFTYMARGRSCAVRPR